MEKTNQNQKQYCPTCGHCISPYKVSVTPMMVHALIKFRQAVIDKGENSVHLLKDFKGKPYELTRHEWNNFSRQRFLGLAVKVENNPGYWLLTRRGAEFLNGITDIPAHVWIEKDKIIDRSETRVYVVDVIKSTPYLETKNDIEYRWPNVSEPLPTAPKFIKQEALL